MNAAIRAVVRKGLSVGCEVIGIRRGYAGLLANDVEALDVSSVADIIHRGGTYLRTARSDEFVTPAGQERALEVLRLNGIEGLVVIGGDGSFRGAERLYRQGIMTVGVPATIDNDIPGTEETIGFDTAVNTAVEAIDRIRDTATSHERIFIIEVMGRDAGMIALQAGLAGGAESILVPEEPLALTEVCQRLGQSHLRGKLYSIIVVSEGVTSGYAVSKFIMETCGLETRVTVLGHVQRGGTPSARDRILATIMGAEAVDVLSRGQGGMMVGMQGGRIVVSAIGEALKQPPYFDTNMYNLAVVLAK
jgi:6-phosphofructokinase 1